MILWSPTGWAFTPALPQVICLPGLAAAREDALQIHGLADVPDGREGAHKPLPGQVAPAAAPWSGAGAQARSRGDAARFAADARPRACAARDTAGGRAIRLPAARSAALPGCRRRVIDSVGDDTGHAGCPAFRHRRGDFALTARGPDDCPRNAPTGCLRTPAKRAR